MILLTGTSGFIGKHLLTESIKEFGKENVIAFTSKPVSGCKYILHNGYDFDHDIFEKAAVADSIETIIHAGAFTPKHNREANSWQDCNNNISGTAKLIGSKLPSLKKFIYLSTLDVYKTDDVITEDTVVAPISLYAHSKLYCEKMIQAWADVENKIVQLLRVGHVYGPGEEAYEKLIPLTIKKLIDKDPVQLFGEGKEMRSFIYIKDVVRAVINSVKLPTNAGVINIVSSNAISVKELLDKLIEISGQTPVIEMKPPGSLSRNFVFDNSRMKKYLLAGETPLQEGLYCEWQYMKDRQA